jgi:Leucine-rich repeat (LRR) protein
MTQLKRVFLDGTSVTPSGLRRIEREIPNTEIHADPQTLSGFRFVDEWNAVGRWDDDYNLISLSFKNTEVPDAVLDELKNRRETRSLKTLTLYNVQISDRGIKHVAALQELELLSLTLTPVSTTGLAQLSALTNLRTLMLGGTRLTDQDLVHLKGMTNLESLFLGTPLTDAGLVHLTALQNLRHLYVRETKVTKAGLQRLKRSLPELKVTGP